MNDNNAFTVTVRKNGVTLTTFRKRVVQQDNVPRWDGFRAALKAVRDETNGFLTEEVASMDKKTI